jgi:hypothetical protein
MFNGKSLIKPISKEQKIARTFKIDAVLVKELKNFCDEFGISQTDIVTNAFKYAIEEFKNVKKNS